MIPAWSFFLLGLRSASLYASEPVASRSVAGGLLCLTAILACAYLINQVFDRKSDALNDKGHYLTRGIFGTRTVVIMAVLFFAVASTFFRMSAPAQRPALVAALALSLFYSLPPLRLCARPVLDLLSNALGYGGVAFAVGFAAVSPDHLFGWMRAVPYIFLVGATFLHTTILDVDGDRRSGKISTTVKIGVGWSALWSVLLAAAGTGWAVAVSWQADGDPFAPLLLIGGLVGFFVAYLRIRAAVSEETPSMAEVERTSSGAVQLATALVALAAVVVEYRFAFVLVPLVLLSRYYYRARFGLNYPGPSASPDA
jgi:4-hydroxybenzoate polyprenyltransferase